MATASGMKPAFSIPISLPAAKMNMAELKLVKNAINPKTKYFLKRENVPASGSTCRNLNILLPLFSSLAVKFLKANKTSTAPKNMSKDAKVVGFAASLPASLWPRNMPIKTVIRKTIMAPK